MHPNHPSTTLPAMQDHTEDEPAPILQREMAMRLKEEPVLEKENSPTPVKIDYESRLTFAIESFWEHQKMLGPGCSAHFNRKIPRVLDIELLHDILHEDVVCSVRFSHDGKYVATGSSRAVQVFDVTTGQEICCFRLEDDNPVLGSNYVRSVCFSPDGRYLAAAMEDKLIRICDIAFGGVKSTPRHAQGIYSLDFACDGRTIASGSGDTVRLWDIETGSETLVLESKDLVASVAFSPDAKHGRRFEGHKDAVYSVAFAPNNKRLVSASLDNNVRMWELTNNISKSGRCIKTFEGHEKFALSATFTPDEKWIISGSKDNEIRFWNVETGEWQLIIQGHENSIVSVAASPMGGCFASASGDRSMKIWSYKTI